MGLTACAAGGGPVADFPSDSTRLRVAASFYPLYEFASAVGGDAADVINLVPVGVEPHDWEPTPAHIRVLNKAQVFVYNGAGLEHWVAKTQSSLDNRQLINVETTAGYRLLAGSGGENPHDPHIWLDPLGAIFQVESIRAAMTRADPAHQKTYAENAGRLMAGIRAVHQEFETGLLACKRRELFTSHAAFGYLADRYGLKQHAIVGLSPNAEPKPGDLARIVADARALQVKYVFFETLASDRVANVVATEMGAKTLVLNPFEGLTAAEVKAGKGYSSVMRDNLANLRLALECGG